MEICQRLAWELRVGWRAQGTGNVGCLRVDAVTLGDRHIPEVARAGFLVLSQQMGFLVLSQAGLQASSSEVLQPLLGPLDFSGTGADGLHASVP